MRIDSSTFSNLAFGAACLVVVALGGIQIWDRVQRPSASTRVEATDVSPTDVSVVDVPVQGSAAAKIAVIEFSDFQCPFCGRYARETYQELKRDFVASGKVKYFFVNMPLPNHPYARPAAEAAGCAHAQGRFWQMHDELFASQKLDPAEIASHAKTIGLDAAAFQACLGNGDRQSLIRDLELAKQLGVQNTPSFLIGDVNADGTVRVKRKIVGAHPSAVFRQALEQLLSAT